MSDDTRRVADYFVICGLPPPEKQQQLDEYSLEVNLKPSHNQDPITDITVIFPGLGENVPDYYHFNLVPGSAHCGGLSLVSKVLGNIYEF